MHYGFITLLQIFGPLQAGTLLFGTVGIGTALWYGVMAYYLSTASLYRRDGHLSGLPDSSDL